MKRMYKREFIILSVIIIALLFYLLMRNPDRLHYRLPEMKTLESAKIDRMVIETTDGEIELHKSDDRWSIKPGKFPADNEKIAEMVDVLAALKLSDVISESRNYSRYGLDQANRIRVKLYSGEDMIRSLFIGKQAATYRHTYVKLPDDPRVFHAADAFRSQFEVEIDDLRDKKVFAVEPSRIQNFTLRGSEFVLTAEKELMVSEPEPAAQKKDSAAQESSAPVPVWKTSEGETLDAEAVDALLSRLSALTCRSFITAETKSRFSDPIYSIELNGSSLHTLNIFAREGEDGEYPAVSSQSDYPFTLAAYTAEDLMKSPEDLRVKEEGKRE